MVGVERRRRDGVRRAVDDRVPVYEVLLSVFGVALIPLDVVVKALELCFGVEVVVLGTWDRRLGIKAPAVVGEVVGPTIERERVLRVERRVVGRLARALIRSARMVGGDETLRLVRGSRYGAR